MGQTGNMVFFTQTALHDPRQVLRRALAITESQAIVFAYRTREEDREWDAYQRSLQLPDLPAPQVTAVSVPAEERVARNAPVESGPELYLHGTRLSVYLATCPMGMRIEHATQRGIPDAVRGSYQMGDMFIWIGWHDVFESAEHARGHRFGRPFFSVRFHGHNSPNDWAEYRRLVFALPEVIDARLQFESIVGPLEQCVYWSV